jgi:hypothetical protein
VTAGFGVTGPWSIRIATKGGTESVLRRVGLMGDYASVEVPFTMNKATTGDEHARANFNAPTQDAVRA